MISTQVGRYIPQLNVSLGCESVGTIIRNRSIHIPTTISADAIIPPLIVRVRRKARIGNGIMNQHATIPQNIGAYAPLTLDLKTAISLGSLPYHEVRYSANVK